MHFRAKLVRVTNLNWPHRLADLFARSTRSRGTLLEHMSEAPSAIFGSLAVPQAGSGRAKALQFLLHKQHDCGDFSGSV